MSEENLCSSSPQNTKDPFASNGGGGGGENLAILFVHLREARNSRTTRMFCGMQCTMGAEIASSARSTG